MSNSLPACREVDIVTFRGNRTKSFARAFKTALNDQRSGRGPGPSRLESLLFTGHTGVSIDGGLTYFGFTPGFTSLPAYRMMDDLVNGQAVAGIVQDDTAVFGAAHGSGLKLLSLTIILPDPQFREFAKRLDGDARRVSIHMASLTGMEIVIARPGWNVSVCPC